MKFSITTYQLKKYLKYLLKGLGVLIGVILLVYASAYTYVMLNKKEIVENVRKQIGKKLTGDVKIGDVELSFFSYFPTVSVLLKDLSITDTMFAAHGHPFFQAEKLYARISLVKVVQKKDPLNGLRIDNGQLYVYTDTSGYTNSYLFTGKDDVADSTRSKGSSIIKDINLRDVRLIMDNKQRRKLYDFSINKMDCKIETNDTTLSVKTKNSILIHSIAFNLDKGSFASETLLEGDIDVLYKKNSKRLSFSDVMVDLKGHPFGFSGFFNLGEERTFNLKISTLNVDYNFARSILSKKISTALGRFKAEKPLDAIAEIGGPLRGEPLVTVQWETKNNNLQTPFVNVTNATLRGSYTNELVPGLPRMDENSRVQFHDFTGTWEGLIVKSKDVYIDNLSEPMVNGDIKTEFKLTALNELLQSNTIKLNGGSGYLDILYSGPLQENTRKNTLINGKIVLTDGLISYKPRNIQLKDCDGTIVFKNSDVLVTGFHSNVEGNRIEMSGRANNLLSLIKTNPGKISLDWNVYSPNLNLQTFTSLLKKRGKVATASGKASAKLNKLAGRIDQMMDEANIRLDLKADRLTFKKFIAQNVVASIGLFTDSYNLNKVSLQHGGGSMLITGSVRGENELYQEAKVKVNMDNVDINKVLYAFDNFGQDAIMSDNIRGKFTSAIDVRMDIDRELAKHPQNLAGYVDFSLKNGALVNFEPIQKLQNFLFKNRNFSDVRFAELKDRLEIQNRDIKINRMEIQSTALTLFVEGIYSLKGNTDISIQVPLSNLRRRSENYKPENIGADAKGGTSVFVRGRPGDDGNIKFKYDLFKKLRKEPKSQQAAGQ